MKDSRTLAPSSQSNYCVASIVGQDVGVEAWIVGDAFLRNVYTVFNVGTSSVGFANLA